jgi:hypothetical protein
MTTTILKSANRVPLVGSIAVACAEDALVASASAARSVAEEDVP